MIRRWGRYVAGSYPPLISVLFAAAWAYGLSGLFAAVDPSAERWLPDGGTALAAVTLVVVLLLMRAVDDIRDLDYDRRLSLDRPLAAGQVRVRDLVVLYVVGAVLLLALNAAAPAALAVLAVQLGYAAAVLAVYQRWGLPSGDNLVLSLLVSFPAQLLLHLYLYAVYLDGTGPLSGGLLAIVVVVLASLHVELAKKITRFPAPGERSYVRVFGLGGATAIALAAPVLSATLLTLLVVGMDGSASGWLALVWLPLLVPAISGWRFWRTTSTRWPSGSPALYLLLTFVSYVALGLT